jgi:uncharacterized protein YndB with AHSA1/START domain
MPDFSTSIDIVAPPEVVFEYLVTAERMVSWMGQHAQLVPVPGGQFAVDVNGYLLRGEYVEVDRPHRVVVSWGMAGAEDLPPGSSRVEFTLTRTAMGTTLSLVHSGLPDERGGTHSAGWANYLARLQTAARGIDPGPDNWIPVKEDAMELAKRRTADLIDAYYGSWRNGISSFDQARVGEVLAEDLDFEGPIAGKRRGSQGFVVGLTRFVTGLQAPIRVLQQIDSGDEAAVLYDADLPEGTMRFAEFFQLGEGRINAIKLLYDAAQYRALGGR